MTQNMDTSTKVAEYNTATEHLVDTSGLLPLDVLTALHKQAYTIHSLSNSDRSHAKLDQADIIGAMREAREHDDYISELGGIVIGASLVDLTEGSFDPTTYNDAHGGCTAEDAVAQLRAEKRREQNLAQAAIKERFTEAKRVFESRLDSKGRLDISDMARAEILMLLQHEAATYILYHYAENTEEVVQKVNADKVRFITIDDAAAALERKHGVSGWLGGVPIGTLALTQRGRFLNVTGAYGFDRLYPGGTLRALAPALLELAHSGRTEETALEFENKWINGEGAPEWGEGSPFSEDCDRSKRGRLTPRVNTSAGSGSVRTATVPAARSNAMRRNLH